MNKSLNQFSSMALVGLIEDVFRPILYYEIENRTLNNCNCC